jgi:hypothetical protein
VGWNEGLFDFLESGDVASKLTNIFAGVAGGGLTVLVAGYAIGTCTQCLLRLLFACGRLRRCLLRKTRWSDSRFHEAALTESGLKKAWDDLDGANDSTITIEEKRKQELSVGAAFGYSIVRRDHKGVHEWLFRRWHGFNVAANSFVGLVGTSALQYSGFFLLLRAKRPPLPRQRFVR